MISTISMVGIGKVYKNLMVDVQRNNLKLEQRAINIIKTATEVDNKTAKTKLEEANGSVKLAITMILLKCDVDTAKQKLETSEGSIRKAIQK